MQNEILMALPDRDRAALLTKLEFVDLPVQTILNEAEQSIKFGYFMNSGLASILSAMACSQQSGTFSVSPGTMH